MRHWFVGFAGHSVVLAFEELLTPLHCEKAQNLGKFHCSFLNVLVLNILNVEHGTFSSVPEIIKAKYDLVW